MRRVTLQIRHRTDKTALADFILPERPTPGRFPATLISRARTSGFVREWEQQGRRIEASCFRSQFALVSLLLRAALDELCRDSVLRSGPQCRLRDVRGPTDDIPCPLPLSKLAT